MSLKTYDGKGRWRNKTVSFRMSPEEAGQLDELSKLSGLTKQDYMIRRALGRDIIVNGNPRVFKALRNRLESALNELRRLDAIGPENDELIALIHYIAEIMNGLKTDGQ